MALEIALGVFIGMMGYRFVIGDWLTSKHDDSIVRFLCRLGKAVLFVYFLASIYWLIQHSGGAA